MRFNLVRYQVVMENKSPQTSKEGQAYALNVPTPATPTQRDAATRTTKAHSSTRIPVSSGRVANEGGGRGNM